MERIKISTRNNWQAAVENLGFGFHSTDVPYWDESVYYKFSEREINKIEKATAELWDMCLNAVQYVIDKKLYAKFHIPEWIIPDLEKSWDNDLPSIYGRLDLAYKNGEIKLLEFNADTPTSLYEAGIVQWFWLQDFDKEKDQFNSIHEKLIAYWSELKKHLHQGKLHFTCIKDSLEDLTTVEYLRDCAIQAGIETKLVFIDDIGWDFNGQFFVDADDEQIRNIFKLYPYEWLLNEDFGKNLTVDLTNTLWIEPLWKMILSNKAILPILWEIYPHHPYLLKTYFDKGDLVDYAKKPILSREGSNIELFKDGRSLEKTDGEYGEEGFIYQDLFELPDFDGNYPLIGSWIIGQMPAGIGVREANRLITDNKSRFVPHLIG
ncbi:glutathionylspermidine synthase family protein [Pedobacter cryotolerans]|uniref:Glutathionylspermidine synthase family protein n=1 Tax=Pedobacter cryotolerans TaxID=2571270 RepID=A0A4U1CBZ7_9SPHI|nr:glutathionylspermidine synthase family protein [Pedobacter cryotolerans]TKC03565.1 glutathionylspermidine synthase family protein [Pedobacter cryotolerans]